MIIIPDVHGRDFWKSAVEGRENEEIIFLGDYVDPYTSFEGVEPWEGMMSLLEVIKFKKEHPYNVTLLLGNHDLSYISDSPKCRYDYENCETIRKAILDNLSLFKIAHEKTLAGKRYIFSHAGILPDWLHENEMTLGQLKASNVVKELNKKFVAGHLFIPLCDVSFYRGGYHEAGSCVWADINEHLYCSDSPNALFPSNVYQIFGHTLQLSERPIITPRFACLDCRKAFLLNQNGKICELNSTEE